jgi:hypothetical protein
MDKSCHKAWKIVPLRHFSPLKVVPLIEVLLYDEYADPLIFAVTDVLTLMGPAYASCERWQTAAIKTVQRGHLLSRRHVRYFGISSE